jgi:hypothetical protein
VWQNFGMHVGHRVIGEEGLVPAHPPDVMYFNEWPMRHEALLFGGLAYGRQDYLDLWTKLPAASTVEEVVRNYFIRQPILWT